MNRREIMVFWHKLNKCHSDFKKSYLPAPFHAEYCGKWSALPWGLFQDLKQIILDNAGMATLPRWLEATYLICNGGHFGELYRCLAFSHEQPYFTSVKAWVSPAGVMVVRFYNGTYDHPELLGVAIIKRRERPERRHR